MGKTCHKILASSIFFISLPVHRHKDQHRTVTVSSTLQCDLQTLSPSLINTGKSYKSIIFRLCVLFILSFSLVISSFLKLLLSFFPLVFPSFVSFLFFHSFFTYNLILSSAWHAFLLSFANPLICSHIQFHLSIHESSISKLFRLNISSKLLSALLEDFFFTLYFFSFSTSLHLRYLDSTLVFSPPPIVFILTRIPPFFSSSLSTCDRVIHYFSIHYNSPRISL